MRDSLAALVCTLALVCQVPVAAQTGGTAGDLASGIRQVEEGDLEAAVLTLDTFIRRASGEKDREKDLALAHLYLSMAHLGLSQWEKAKADMRDAWRNNRDLKLDPRKFPPRVMQLYEETKPQAAPAASGASSSTATPQGEKGAAANKGGSKTLLVVAGVAVGGGVAAALAASGGGMSGGEPTTPVTTAPGTDDLRFLSAEPSAGSTISVGRGGAVLRVMATVVYHETGRYILFSTAGHPICVAGGALIDIVANQPRTVTVELEYPPTFPNAPPACPLPFTSQVITLQLAIPDTQDAAGVRIPEKQFPAGYTFVP